MLVVQDLGKKNYDSKFKVAAMPICGKKRSNDFFSRTTVPIRLIFCISIWGTLLYKMLKSLRSDHKQTLSGWGKVGKNDTKFPIHEPFELES